MTDYQGIEITLFVNGIEINDDLYDKLHDAIAAVVCPELESDPENHECHLSFMGTRPVRGDDVVDDSPYDEFVTHG